jgi:uncharacterized protein
MVRVMVGVSDRQKAGVATFRRNTTMAYTDVEVAEAHALAKSQEASGNDLYKLGLIYATGMGCDADYVQAHMWFNLAASRGCFEARASRKELAEMMSRDELNTALRMAREWLSTRKH